jgi:hypothetical protein
VNTKWADFNAEISLFTKYSLNESEDYLSEIGSIPLAYTSYGVGLSWAQMWGQRFRSELKFTYLEFLFKNHSLPDDRKRQDTSLQLSTRLDYLLSPAWRPYISLDSLQNSSTMDDDSIVNKNYSQVIVYLGFEWNLGL